MPSLYEQIEEEAKAIGETPLTFGEDDENHDAVNDAAADSPDADAEPEGAPPGDGGTPSDDDGSAQGDDGVAQKDGDAPQKDGEDVLKEPTNADWARQRREMRELKAKLAALEKPPEVKPELKAEARAEAKPAVKELPKEPSKEENYQAWLEWKLTQNDSTVQEQKQLITELSKTIQEDRQAKEKDALIRNAVDEFTGIEDSYKAVNPDYADAMEFSRGKYAESIKILYPQMTPKQIDQAIDFQVLNFASDCAKKGLNPAEELFDMAIERFGYAKQEKAAETPKPRPEKPNLKVISHNKKRSATPLAGGGQGGSLALTKEAAADMSVGEYSRLSPDQLAQLEEM